MKAKLLVISMLASTPLFGAHAKEGPGVQEIRLELDHAVYKMNSHEVEIELLQEKFSALDKRIGELKRELGKGTKEEVLGKRLSSLEKSQEALVADLKTLKDKVDRSATQIASVEKQVASELKGLKGSLEALATLLKGDEKSYVVKDGDSLGKIAHQHQVSLSRLREANRLSSDKIYVGQKLILP